jgi:hypothetical protein
MTMAPERAGLHVDDAVDVTADEGQIVTRRQWPRVTMADLLARFDPAKHRHGIAFNGDPVGSETRWGITFQNRAKSS